MALIGDIQLDRTEVGPGESFHITVTPEQGHDPDVAVDGLRGGRQYLQAPTIPGTHTVEVLAGEGAEIEHRSVTFTVADRAALPLLTLEHDPYRPLAAALRLMDTVPEDRRIRTEASAYRWDIAGTEVVTAEPVLLHDFASHVDHHQPFTPVDVSVRLTDEDGGEHLLRRTVAVWSSYQLVRATGVVQPVVTGPGLARHRVGTTWSGTAPVTNVEDVPVRLTSRRTEWLTSELEAEVLPGAPESVDIVLPPDATTSITVEVDRAAAPRGVDGFTAHLFGESGDGTPAHVVLTFEFARRRLWDKLMPHLDLLTKPDLLDEIAHVVGPDNDSPRPEWLDSVVGSAVGNAVDERALWSLGAAARGSKPSNVRRVEEGHAPPELDRTSAKRLLERLDTDGTVFLRAGQGGRFGSRGLSRKWGAAELREVATAVQSGVSLTVEGLEPVVQELRDGDLGLIDVWAKRHVRLEVALAGLLDRPVEGSICDPDDLPDDVPDGWACQYTGQDEQQWLPGRIVNAKKGDLVLSPGGNGLIGGLLKQVNPPQRYSHCGIMTRNYYELAHSTASDAWLMDHPNGSILGEPAPTDGFQPAVLKYLWPGGVVQTAEEAFRGSEFTAPGGKKYRLAAFSAEGSAQFGDRWELIPAMVVKPHPQKETPAVRKALHRIANQVRAWSVTGPDTEAGRQSALHYRFFCYTDAAIAVRPDPATGKPVGLAPEGAGWPAGTLPTVCSQVIWLAARGLGHQVEGPGAITTPADLEPDDVGRGAQVDEHTLDGLYFYTAEERRAAAQWLHTFLGDKITTSVINEAGDVPAALIEAFSDIADDCANQVLNTFAHDWSDTEAKDSERWLDEVHPGRAVSPDNLMFFDSPNEITGLWGYVVPLLYRAGRFEQVPVSKWRRTTGPGTLTGLVRHAGAPAPDAEVNIGGTVVFTGGDGRFRVDVQEGRYKLHVRRQSPYGLSEVKRDVMVNFDETTDVTVDLEDPPEMYREVRLIGTADGNDDEGLFEDDENMHEGVHIGPIRVGPYGTHGTAGWRKGWGGEVRAEFDFTVDWLPDNAVDVHVAGRLFEGTSESTTDLDGTTAAHWRVPAGDTQVREVYVRNDDDDENTWCRLVLHVSNQRAP